MSCIVPYFLHVLFDVCLRCDHAGALPFPTVSWLSAQEKPSADELQLWKEICSAFLDGKHYVASTDNRQLQLLILGDFIDAFWSRMYVTDGPEELARWLKENEPKGNDNKSFNSIVVKEALINLSHSDFRDPTVFDDHSMEEFGKHVKSMLSPERKTITPLHHAQLDANIRLWHGAFLLKLKSSESVSRMLRQSASDVLDRACIATGATPDSLDKIQRQQLLAIATTCVQKARDAASPAGSGSGVHNDGGGASGDSASAMDTSDESSVLERSPSKPKQIPTRSSPRFRKGVTSGTTANQRQAGEGKEFVDMTKDKAVASHVRAPWLSDAEPERKMSKVRVSVKSKLPTHRSLKETQNYLSEKGFEVLTVASTGSL